MNEEQTEQPAAERLCPQCQEKMSLRWPEKICRQCLRKARLAVAAHGAIDGSLADRTAFACSALLASEAGLREEAAMLDDRAKERAEKGDYAGAAKDQLTAEGRRLGAYIISSELWRAGLASEANR